MLGAIWICQRLDHSRVGRAWVAIREDEVAAELMGVEVTKQKVVAFGLSAAFAGLAGAIFAHWEGFVTPESFTFWESALLVCAVVLGGMGSIVGVLLGALCIVLAPEVLRSAPGPLTTEEIWTLAAQRGLHSQLRSIGQTPVATLYADLHRITIPGRPAVFPRRRFGPLAAARRTGGELYKAVLRLSHGGEEQHKYKCAYAN